MDVALEAAEKPILFGMYKFQSLFSWMLRSKSYSSGVMFIVILFQSLFSWMLRSKGIGGIHGARLVGFNPCSRGCCARSLPVLFNRIVPDSSFNPCSRGCCARRALQTKLRRIAAVSILVLVDVALEVRYTGNDTGFPFVSILVLVDVALEAIGFQ